jgi:hypothetical protein
MMQLVFGAVQNAMSDSESVLSRAVHAALKVGVGKPARWLFGGAGGLGEAAAVVAELEAEATEATDMGEGDDAEDPASRESVGAERERADA